MPGRHGPAVRSARRTLGILVLVLFMAAAAAGLLGFRSLLTEMAVSSAQDAVILAVNEIVRDETAAAARSAGGLVTLERNADGSIAAVTTNVAAVNSLASRVLARAVEQTAEKEITVSVPVGNLLGSTLFLGKGPSIPVEVVMLSSSAAGFRSELTTAGINQTRHRILLELNVQVSLFMPWRIIATAVDTEILVSETVIVGGVPESYMNWD